MTTHKLADWYTKSSDSLLFAIQMRDDRIAELQRIADLARAFVDQINPLGLNA